MGEVDSVLEDKFPSRDIFVILILCCSVIPLMALICHILKMFQSRLVKLQATNILPTEVINDVVQFMAVEDLKRLRMTSRVLHVHISRRLQKIKPSTESSKASFIGIVSILFAISISVVIIYIVVIAGNTLLNSHSSTISTEYSKAAHPPIKGNPTKWTCEDVSQWFTDAGYPELAKKFLDQEYDGEAIMLFKRDDLISLIYRNEEINFFGLKQAPALKVHALIEELKKASQRMSE